MRFPTEYTCNLLNEARHTAFGKIAAKMVLESIAGDWPKVNFAMWTIFLIAYERLIWRGNHMTILYKLHNHGKNENGSWLENTPNFSFKIIALIIR